ncbi:hypothetical protein KKC_02479 [Listeria fleischmannii subsp. coloradonensis]|nr:hypothetical protein KKC_02479 [Listeria fleischmannii subsp. coloradonensis]
MGGGGLGGKGEDRARGIFKRVPPNLWKAIDK